MNKLTGKTLGNIIVIVAIMIIPLMYGGLLTSAYQNPTNRLQTMTAAVVNEDSPVDVTLADGSVRHFALGDELADKLTNPDGNQDVGFTWKTMNVEQATAALKNEDVRAVLTIPSDFTRATTEVGTATADKATRQTIRLVTDDGVNYLSGTLARSVALALQGELTTKGASIYIENILMSLETVKEGMGKAADGSSDLSSGATALSFGLADLAGGTQSAASGSVQLAEGAGRLANGTGSAAEGAQTLNEGSRKLTSGAADLDRGVIQYTDGVSQLVGGTSDLNGGVAQYTGGVELLRQQVVNGTSEAPSLISVTQQLSAGAQSLNQALTKLSQGAGSSNAGADPSSHQLVPASAAVAAGASQLSGQLHSDAATAGLTQLAGAASQLPTSVNSYTGAVDQLAKQVCAAGESDLCSQLSALSQNSAGLQELAAGINGGINGDSGVVSRLNNVSGAVDALASGTSQIEAGARQVAGGLEQVTASGAAPALQSGAQQLAAAVGLPADSYQGGQATIAGALNDLNAKSPALGSGALALNKGASTLAASSPSLRTGSGQLAQGASAVESGASNLSAGLRSLGDGAETVSSGSLNLADGLASLNAGAQEATAGATKVAHGSAELSNSLQDGAGKIPAFSNQTSSNIANVVSEPVRVAQVRANAVPNNGAGFTPMFMSLALWVGGIATFLVLPALSRRKSPSEPWWKTPLRPAAQATALGVAQAILLIVVTNWAVGLHAQNLPGLILMAIATSLTFVALNQMFVATLAYRGRFVSIILLCLQITSMGATFPIETAPRFFQWIHPLLPMSYTQLAFREMIAGTGADGAVPKALVILAIYFLASVALIFFAAKKRRGPRPLPVDNALLGDSLAAERAQNPQSPQPMPVPSLA